MTAAIFGMGPLEFIIVVSVILLLFFPAVISRVIKRFSSTASTLRDMADDRFHLDDEDDELH